MWWSIFYYFIDESSDLFYDCYIINFFDLSTNFVGKHGNWFCKGIREMVEWSWNFAEEFIELFKNFLRNCVIYFVAILLKSWLINFINVLNNLVM
jgi:hypothetical protein